MFSRRQLRLVVLALWSSGLPNCLAGGGPENVFLLVNSASRDSMTVANHYVDLRKIPPQNVFYIHWKRSVADIRGLVFRKEILLPALEEIDRRKLGGQIDYLIYSCDFPWRVLFAKDFPQENFPPALKPTASLTGATYLWSFVKNERKEMFGLTTNFYYSPHRAGITLTRAFRARHYWNPDGRRTTSAKGIPYLLSTMLGVTYGRGNSVEEIVRYLERASKADGTKPGGTIYYVKNNSPRSTPRHDRFPQAVSELALAGVHAEILEGSFPQNKPQVMGVTCGAPRLNIAQSGCRFQPGALGDNLTSAGGNLIIRKLKGPDQTPLSEFLRFGAAGACGTVVEPMNFPQKFPSPFLHVHYARGCSLAEAFYQSIAGPYQQLIVGDPLCQPWADRPEVTVEGVHNGARLSETVTITPSAKTSETKAVAYLELYVDGQRLQRCKPGGQFSLDTTTMADGSHELRVVATDDTAIESQGRWIGEVIVKNGLDAVQLLVNEAQLTKGMEFLTVNVASSRKEAVTVLHNGREVGSVARGTGTVRIAVETLGAGPVILHAQSEGEPALRSRPVRVFLP
ncbi:MAG: TIGR03790 family protein [Planctomycetes bacterium]|nr:TIGR03790 family protein [Planctomycetota bacterium]